MIIPGERPDTHMSVKAVIVIGASGGGVDAMSRVVAGLPADLDAAVFVVMHLAPTTPSVLAAILDRAGPLRADDARDGEPIRAGRIYVAPPDRHLLVNAATVELTGGPRENHQRPAVDVLFRSAAVAYGARALGVILTGALDDGTAGLYSIRTHGGLTFVQDPAEAAYPSMPTSALEIVRPHHVLRLDAMGRSLAQHVAGYPPLPTAAAPPERDAELDTMRKGAATIDDTARSGTGDTPLSCPECNGPLREVVDGPVSRFRCHTGHVYSPESLFDGQIEDVERALWSALRALDENADLARRLGRRASEGAREALARRFEERAEESARGREVIKEILKGRAGSRRQRG